MLQKKYIYIYELMPVKGLEIITKLCGGTKPIWRLHGLFIKRIALPLPSLPSVQKQRFILCETHTIYHSVQRTSLSFINKNSFLRSTPPSVLLRFISHYSTHRTLPVLAYNNDISLLLFTYR